MKSYELNSNSWHYKLANFGYRRVSASGSNICEYTRAVIAGAVLAVATVIMFIVVGIGLSYGVYGIAMSLFTLTNVLNPVSLLILGGLSGLGGLFLIGGIKHYLDNRTVKFKPETPPSFPTLAYRKFKDKTCFKINFK